MAEADSSLPSKLASKVSPMSHDLWMCTVFHSPSWLPNEVSTWAFIVHFRWLRCSAQTELALSFAQETHP